MRAVQQDRQKRSQNRVAKGRDERNLRHQRLLVESQQMEIMKRPSNDKNCLSFLSKVTAALGSVSESKVVITLQENIGNRSCLPGPNKETFALPPSIIEAFTTS